MALLETSSPSVTQAGQELICGPGWQFSITGSEYWHVGMSHNTQLRLDSVLRYNSAHNMSIIVFSHTFKG